MALGSSSRTTTTPLLRGGRDIVATLYGAGDLRGIIAAIIIGFGALLSFLRVALNGIRLLHTPRGNLGNGAAGRAPSHMGTFGLRENVYGIRA